jgi:glycosyltransferase involved in cell wall biosynthesis
MNKNSAGNLLLVSNYPSDTAYAWWLMEYFWVSIAEHFNKLGNDIYLAYPEVKTVSNKITASPLKVVELTIPWQNADQKSAACRFIQENNISTIYFTDQAYFKFQYPLMRHYGVRHIINHDHTPGDRAPVGGLKGALKMIKNTLPWFTADSVLCVSKYMRERNITNTRIPAHKCHVVQNGIQPVNCDQHQNPLLKEELGINDESLLVITTGRADPYKRFNFIIDTANELVQQSPECKVTFLLIGDGPAMQDLEKQIRSLKLEDTVHLAGYRNDVRDILCISDIAMHAAMGEGFSLSIIEYMSAGLPVLVPDIPSVSQAVTHNKTGLIYKKDDPKDAAIYIEELANNEKLRLAMGCTAKGVANNNYSLEQCTRTLIKEIKNVYFSDT